jgi:pSer/pThr/pTyr-binding forkhead associated (FHA) protein
LAQLLFFENFRFGLAVRKENLLMIEVGGVVREFREAVVTVGRDEENEIRLKDNFVSRRHCVFVNFASDVWIYDPGSKYGVLVDGKVVDRKAYLDGVHIVTLGDMELKVSSKAGLLV